MMGLTPKLFPQLGLPGLRRNRLNRFAHKTIQPSLPCCLMLQPFGFYQSDLLESIESPPARKMRIARHAVL